MNEIDVVGRRRRPGQSRGLRPLFPKLPAGFESRLVRIAMASAAWRQLEDLLHASSAPTMPLAWGDLLVHALAIEQASENDASAYADEVSGYHDWQLWQKEKEL